MKFFSFSSDWGGRLGMAALLLMLAAPLSAEPPVANNAIVPVGKLENDFYNWNERHAAVLAIKGKINPEVVLIGDSITHLWGGEPNEPKGNRGKDSWQELFGSKPALNLGFGWDRTQNVLYRIQEGELDGLKPKTIVIHIGTNNLAGTKNARENTPEEIAAAIGLIVEKAQEKCPEAQVILMAVFPRGQNATDPRRAKIAEINKLLSGIASRPRVTLVDITSKLMNTDGTITREVMADFLHPAAKGYAVWAEALKPLLR